MNIPHRILKEFSQASRGMEFGKVLLELHVNHGDPRFVINTQKSFRLTKEEREVLFQGEKEET